MDQDIASLLLSLQREPSTPASIISATSASNSDMPTTSYHRSSSDNTTALTGLALPDAGATQTTLEGRPTLLETAISESKSQSNPKQAAGQMIAHPYPHQSTTPSYFVPPLAPVDTSTFPAAFPLFPASTSTTFNGMHFNYDWPAFMQHLPPPPPPVPSLPLFSSVSFPVLSNGHHPLMAFPTPPFPTIAYDLPHPSTLSARQQQWGLPGSQSELGRPAPSGFPLSSPSKSIPPHHNMQRLSFQGRPSDPNESNSPSQSSASDEHTDGNAGSKLTPMSSAETAPVPKRKRMPRFESNKRRTLLCCDDCHRKSLTRFNAQAIIWYRAATAAQLVDMEPGSLCDICGRVLIHDGDHVEASPHERLRGAQLKCYKCGQSFTRGDRLVAHAAKHTKVKAFTCDLCPRNFTRKSRLDEHIQRFHVADQTSS